MSALSSADPPGQVLARVVERGRVLQELFFHCGPWRALEAGPLVSCLMVTRDRAELALRAVRCFQAQTWARRELLILDDSADGALAQAVLALGDERIRFLSLPSEGRTLGELRNQAVAAAAGEFVAQWDDDDLCDPDRLLVQMAAIALFRADGCTLLRERLWWPERRRLALSCRRVWEGSLVCSKAALPPYPALPRGEDTPVIGRLVKRGRVVLLDAPELYTYVLRDAAPPLLEHFERHWEAATERCPDSEYDAALARLATRLPIPAPTPVAPAPRPAAIVTTRPRVLVLTPVRDAAPFLPRHLANLQNLAYPPELLSVGFLEGDSQDGTPDLLEQALPGLRERYRRVELVRRDFGFNPDLPRWDPRVQRQRRGTLARCRNLLLAHALRDEDWVLWIDVDVEIYPHDLLDALLAAGRDIVVPHCVVEPGGRTFDLNTFKLIPGAGVPEEFPYVVDGLLQPPRGVGRTYLEDHRGEALVEVDGVGGCVLLVRADLYREGLIFPAAPYKHFIETEGLAALARDLGYSCWGLPGLEVIHPLPGTRANG